MIGCKNQCFICGSQRNLETHHCLHGPRRAAADKYKLVVRLCNTYHRNLHDHGDHDQELEAIAQTVFEAKYGRVEWMRVFGKNYL